MSYSIISKENKGYLLGDFSSHYLKDWEKASGPAMKKFLDTGEADPKLVKEIVKELETKPKKGRDERVLLKRLTELEGGIMLYG